jgi:alanyl aminopeptidase
VALRLALCVAVLAAACGQQPEEPPPARAPAPAPSAEDVVVPLGRLPADVKPLHYELDLTIQPDTERFSGEAAIEVELERPRSVIWMHGRELDVTEAVVERADRPAVRSAWEQADPEGVVELRPDEPVGPGKVTLRFKWNAAFERTVLGLYRVDAGGDSYAFTQFEPILARRAFPSFDEPRFKTPFDVTLTVRTDDVAVSNAPVLATEPGADGTKRVRFATTAPLPTYLVAFAVGPLDVVDGPPLRPNAIRTHAVPFRGVTARGQGRRLAYAFAHTGPFVEALETYFALPYPYEKLDIIAVPDIGPGGMENAAAITFRESGILLDDAQAPEEQRRGFAYIMAHELSHQWFGDLVTMAWWDDVWLNEAFATWMGTRIVQTVHPEYEANLGLLQYVFSAMDTDGLVSARRIRQPIDSLHDIPNAFDAITYAKGAAVLAMFERWIGIEPFQRGVQAYLGAHRFGSATADDLLQALSEASGRDVATPFRTFLTQPGVPLVEATLACDGSAPRLDLRQSRFLPVGSAGERTVTWQIPVCARYGAERERCTLLAERTGTLGLDGADCSAWVLPNSDGAGYYRWSLSAADLARLQGVAWPALTPRERYSAADSLSAAFAAATVPAAAVFAALQPFAIDPSRPVAIAPMALVGFARDYLADDDAMRGRVEAFGRRLYAPVHHRLGWEPRPGEDGETKLLRAKVIDFLARVARDPAVRREAASRGRSLVGAEGLRLDTVSPELVDVALAVAVEDGDARLFDTLLGKLHASQDDLTRSRILGALGATRDPQLAERARALSLDPRTRLNEATKVLSAQMRERETRSATWEWIKAHFDELTARLSQRGVGSTPWLASSFCDGERAADVEHFFSPRIGALAGGPRNLAGAVEAIRLCAARVAAQRESAREFFGRGDQ